MNIATDRLAELRKLIARADEVYYGSGTGDVEDALYDKWKDELAQLAPDDILLARVGAEVHEGMLQKREHRIPMGSQSKATNREEFRKWTESAGREQLFHASYKMDGGSFSFEYRDGRLFAAISRGDGAVGEDITGNALSFQGPAEDLQSKRGTVPRIHARRDRAAPG
jgi:DNA ligase (NAD+)